MPAYNFKSQFAALVECGAKRQTIRKERKRPTHAGDILILYTGMRTKSARNLGNHWCISLQGVQIRKDAIALGTLGLSPAQADALAAADGFTDAYELTDFMISLYGPLPIADLVLIKWEHLVVATRDLAYAHMRPYHPREDRTTIPAGTMGRILDYHDTGNAWADIAITVEFSGYKTPRTVSPALIANAYAPEYRWTAQAQTAIKKGR